MLRVNDSLCVFSFIYIPYKIYIFTVTLICGLDSVFISATIACQICLCTIGSKDQGYFRFFMTFYLNSCRHFCPGDFHFHFICCVSHVWKIISYPKKFRCMILSAVLFCVCVCLLVHSILINEKSHTHWSALPTHWRNNLLNNHTLWKCCHCEWFSAINWMK